MFIDTTTKKGALLFLVQTYILAAGSYRSKDPLHTAKFANSTLAGLLSIDEADIPDDIEAACEAYVNWQDGRRQRENGEKYPAPAWFNPKQREGEDASGYQYPWDKKADNQPAEPAPAAKQVEKLDMFNSKVWVKLSPRGIQHLTNYCASLRQADEDMPGQMMLMFQKDDGWFQFNIKELARIFGDIMSDGREVPFIGNEAMLVKPF